MKYRIRSMFFIVGALFSGICCWIFVSFSGEPQNSNFFEDWGYSVRVNYYSSEPEIALYCLNKYIEETEKFSNFNKVKGYKNARGIMYLHLKRISLLKKLKKKKLYQNHVSAFENTLSKESAREKVTEDTVSEMIKQMETVEKKQLFENNRDHNPAPRLNYDD